MGAKIIQAEAEFTKRKKNNERNVNFLSNSPFSIKHTNPATLSPVAEPVEILFWYGMNLRCRIYLRGLHVLKSYRWNE